MSTEADSSPVILFDGHCKLCNGWVDFVIKRESRTETPVRFAAIQSDSGRELLAEHDVDPDRVDSIVLVEGGKAYLRSTAVLGMLRYLRAPWRYGTVLRLVPRVLRDLVYRAVARCRYRLFGRREVCRVPGPELAGRFLGGGSRRPEAGERNS